MAKLQLTLFSQVDVFVENRPKTEQSSSPTKARAPMHTIGADITTI